jgi:hypothetical protein
MGREEVTTVPTGLVTRNGQGTPTGIAPVAPARDESALRKLAEQHLERVRRFKLGLAVYAVTMVALTPVWIVTQYETADGWPKHLSSRSRYPGDWDPWLIWVGVVGAVIVAIMGLRAYFDRPTTEVDVDREVERLKSTG